MKKQSAVIIVTLAFLGITYPANAATTLLQTNDLVGITFWTVSMGMLAGAVFFFLERNTVAVAWRASITVAGLVCFIAFVHYIYIRNIWVTTGDVPTAYRYVDWLITIPMQTIEFYLILAAVRKVSDSIFWRLLIASLTMLIGGYLGEAGYIQAFVGFIILIAGWIYILFELFSGEAGRMASKGGNRPLSNAFASMRMIVTIGWAIYPLGYLFGYLSGAIDPNTLNIIYNLADFVNKLAFGLVIWAAAMQNTSSSRR
jgi:bacteriorhodopsin